MRKDREMVDDWRDYAQKFLTATCEHLGIAPEALPAGPTTLEDILSASRGAPLSDDDNDLAVQPTFELGTSHSLLETNRDVKRKGGILDDGSTREIELVNDLLLIALGMGQHRGEDGSTTMFEQEALFGDTNIVHSTPAQVSQTVEEKEDKEESNDSELTFDNAGNKAWGALRSGFSSIGRTTRQVAEKTTKREKKGPTKPNELCHYDARARAIIFVAVTAMDVRGSDVHMAEKVIAQSIYFIMEDARKASTKGGKGDPLQSSDADGARGSYMNTATNEVVEREKSKTNWTKWAAMGAAGVVGGALIGVTGGLAAPLVAPALVGLTGVSFLATTSGVVMMATLLGVSGAGLAGYRVQRRLRGIDKFEFKQVDTVARSAGMAIPSLHATICCSGLQLNEERQGAAFEQAFADTTDARDVFVILSEEEMMKTAGEGLRGYVLDTAIRSGGQRIGTEVLKHTALAGIAALTLPLTAWTAASAALDGVFVQAKSRAYRAGLILADVLRDEVQGHRPVTLIGTSLGCVTIVTALTELAKSPGENAHLVDSVFLIGAPFSPSPATLRRARTVVSRRMVSAYSTRDMVCSIAAWLGSGISLEEVKAGKMPKIVGSGPIADVAGVHNVDVSDLVDSHFRLNDTKVLQEVLQRCRAMQD
jgi:hypothetical protein